MFATQHLRLHSLPRLYQANMDVVLVTFKKGPKQTKNLLLSETTEQKYMEEEVTTGLGVAKVTYQHLFKGTMCCISPSELYSTVQRALARQDSTVFSRRLGEAFTGDASSPAVEIHVIEVKEPSVKKRKGGNPREEATEDASDGDAEEVILQLLAVSPAYHSTILCF